MSADLSSHIFTPSPKTSTKHELLLVVKMPLPHGFRSGVEPDGVVTGAGDGVVAPIVAAIAALVVSVRCAALVINPARALVVTLLYACEVADGIDRHGGQPPFSDTVSRIQAKRLVRHTIYAKLSQAPQVVPSAATLGFMCSAR